MSEQEQKLAELIRCYRDDEATLAKYIVQLFDGCAAQAQKAPEKIAEQEK